MKLLKILFIFSGILTLVVTALLSGIIYLASNSLPHYQQEIKSEDIFDTITISRDAYAIPYIKAKNNSDSFFALGYAHAQDRLWQMILLRRIAQGRLSEIVGTNGLKSDRLMRTLGIYSSAKASEKEQPEGTEELLKSYSNGVNYFIKQISENSLGRGSPEFFLFTPEISPWRPADSIALLKLLAFQSTNKAKMEIQRTRFLLTDMNPERYEDLFREPPLIGNTVNQTLSYLKAQNLPESIDLLIENESKTQNFLIGSIPENSLSASNIFAVMPSRSATGYVLAASDPHANLTTPSNFMLVNLELSHDTITGGTIPGIPAILIGRSKSIGWGMSNAAIDDQDLFIEKVNPLDESEYYVQGGLEKFAVKKEIIRIKNEKSITLTVKNTKNGPVLSSNLLGVDLIRPKGHEISINWTGLSNKDQSLHSIMSIMLSKTIEQAKGVLPILSAPGQNILFVDQKNIELLTAGKIPKRSLNHSTQGKIPSLGWIQENTWSGYLPFDRHPKTKNPSSGIIINTNNKTTDAPFPYHLSYDWGDSQRVIRVKNLLNKRQFHTVSSFKEIQHDTVSISAKILLPLLAQDLWFGQKIDQTDKISEIEEQALKVLSKWNGNMNQNNPEPLIFVSWLREFQRMVMIDDVGYLYDTYYKIRPLFLERVLRNKNGADAWCDIVQTSSKETCEQIAKRSFSIAIKKLQNQFGMMPNDWRWGETHLAIHKSPIIGSWPILSFLTNLVHEVSGGDNTIMMSKMMSSQSNQFIASYGSTLRAIFDFSNNDHSLFIISTGQSGHFLSPHYDDQSQLWQREQYIPIKYDIADRQGGSTATTNLSPVFKEN